MFDPDVWELASILVRKYGAEAASFASGKAEAAATGGEPEDRRIWEIVERAVTELLRTELKADEKVN